MRFGEYFKQRRLALRKTLREFCRENGLDPGNISRLERGLLQPPQGRETLESYAKLLKLKKGSDEWYTFFDLAAAETGRIPAHLVDDPSAVDRLPALFRDHRGAPRQSANWISSVDLENWAKFQTSRSDLPRLIRRLIHADNQTITQIELAAGEGVDRPGFDGVVVAATGSPYVPQGTSVWEMGVGSDPAAKAREEYRKRTAKSLGVDKSEAAIVFCTPRRWKGKEAWQQKKRECGDWRDVRVYDADNLATWLECAPAVDAWFARHVGRRPEGIVDIDEYWTNLSQMVKPALLPAVFLTSRDEDVKAIDKWLDEPASSLAYQSNTAADVIDVFAAYVASREDDERDLRGARVLVVERREAWEALVDSPQKLVLVPKPDLSLESEQVARAVRHGHHVLVAGNRFTGNGFNAMSLSRPIRHELAKALVQSGFDEPKAEQVARECGGSLTVLKRRLPQHPGTHLPKWAETDQAQKLAPFLLIGSWDDSSASDRQIVEQITGRNYAEALADVHQWVASEDAPFVRFLTCWSLTSHEDAWYLLAPYLRPDQLDIFEAAALTVLGGKDPSLDLPEDERWMSGIRGPTRPHSNSLRSGIAETLALLALRSTDRIGDRVTPALRAGRVVRQLLGNRPYWKLWASLSSHLPVLAEAAPDEFLDAVLADVRSETPQLPMLLSDGGAHPLFSRCLHAGLLWALETLAWSSKHLTKVSIALARLAELDTGQSQWHNRPQNSLAEIFLPWLPQTSANVEQRLAVLEKLRDRHGDITWKLLLSMMPSLMMSSTPTPRPNWREWALNWSRGATHSEYWRQVDVCAGWLLEMTGKNADRWIDLIEGIRNFPESRREALIERLAALGPCDFEVDEQRRLSDALREEVSRHERYFDADWAITQDEVDALKRLIDQFESSDPIIRNRWLFDQRPRMMDEDEDSYEVSLARHRQQAIRELMDTKGLPLVLEFANSVRLPRAVGYELARAGLLASDEQFIPVLLDLSTSHAGAFARGFVAGRFKAGEWDWVESLSPTSWKPEQAASFLLALPDDTSTWNYVEKLGPAVERAYWENVVIFSIRNDEAVPFVVQKLLQHDRPYTAIDLLAASLYSEYMPPPSLVTKALLACLGHGREKDKPKDVPQDGIRHDAQQLIAYLQRPDVACSDEQLASIEWAYLSALDGHGGLPATLHKRMQTNPEFFAEVLALIFRSDNDSNDSNEEITEEHRMRARNAYELLHSFNVPPGLDESTGTIDGAVLGKWVSDTRRLCRKAGRISVCDSQIGKMLAHAPEEADGTGPCMAVRDVIDELDTEDLRDGFAIGIMNRRGVYTKSPFEGGNQERKLAETYSKWATACDTKWPTTAAALRVVVDHYEHSARREDEIAESRRHR